MTLVSNRPQSFGRDCATFAIVRISESRNSRNIAISHLARKATTDQEHDASLGGNKIVGSQLDFYVPASQAVQQGQETQLSLCINAIKTRLMIESPRLNAHMNF